MLFFFFKQKTADEMRICDCGSDVCSSDLNVLGVFHCMKHQIAAMLKAGSGGSIVNTASVGGTVAIPAHGEYIAAKHAVIGLTRIAAVDYGQQGIRVNAVLPGAIRTPML